MDAFLQQQQQQQQPLNPYFHNTSNNNHHSNANQHAMAPPSHQHNVNMSANMNQHTISNNHLSNNNLGFQKRRSVGARMMYHSRESGHSTGTGSNSAQDDSETGACVGMRL